MGARRRAAWLHPFWPHRWTVFTCAPTADSELASRGVSQVQALIQLFPCKLFLLLKLCTPIKSSGEPYNLGRLQAFLPLLQCWGKNSDCLLYKSEQFASVQSWTTEQLWWFPTIKRCRKAASLLTWGLVAPRLQLHPYFKVSGIENAGWRLGGMHAKNRSCNL